MPGRFVAALRSLLVLAAFLGARTPAAAHPAPFSYLDIVFRNGGIEGTLVIHVIDAAHELSITPADKLLDSSVLASQRDALTAALAPRIVLRAGRPPQPTWTGVEAMPDEQALKLRFTIPGEQPGAL